MKNIISFATIATLSIVLTACDKPENTGSDAVAQNQAKPAVKVETPSLKAEINQFIQWSNNTTKAQQQSLQEIMKLQGQDLETLKKAYTNVVEVIKVQIDELNTMPLHHIEVKNLREQYAEALNLLHQAMEMSIPYADGNMPNNIRQDITNVRNQSTQKLKAVYTEINRLTKEQSK